MEDNKEAGHSSFDEALQIEHNLYELAEAITDPNMANTIGQIIDAFENKKTAIADLAFRDDKTGLFNNVFFMGKLREEVSRALRYRRDLSLLVIELGESFSETFSKAAEAIDDTMRRSDTCAYIEENTIAVLLPETQSDQAERVAEKLLNSLQPFSAQTAVEAWIGIADLNSGRNNAIKLESAAYQARDAAKAEKVPVHTAAF